MTVQQFCLAAGVGILFFCSLCAAVFGALYLIENHQRKQRDTYR